MIKYLWPLVVIVSFSLSAKTIKIAIGEWEPYHSEYAYEYGLASHIIKEAFKVEGIKVKWGFFPWKRSFELAKEGDEWDATAIWRSSEKAEISFWISVPVVESIYVFFHLKSYKFKWNKMEDLMGTKIGITNGYFYGQKFMDLVKQKKLKIDVVATDEANFKKILSGRIKLFPNDHIVGYTQLLNIFTIEQVNEITHHPKRIDNNPLHLLISKQFDDAEDFLIKFNSGMKKLKKNKKIKKLYNNFREGYYKKSKNRWEYSHKNK